MQLAAGRAQFKVENFRLSAKESESESLCLSPQSSFDLARQSRQSHTSRVYSCRLGCLSSFDSESISWQKREQQSNRRTVRHIDISQRISHWSRIAASATSRLERIPRFQLYICMNHIYVLRGKLRRARSFPLPRFVSFRFTVYNTQLKSFLSPHAYMTLGCPQIPLYKHVSSQLGA